MDGKPYRVLFLEPHFSGSHRSFAQGLAAHSCHDIRLFTLPGVHWKWRMRGSLLHYAAALSGELDGIDLLMVSNMVDLARLKGLVTSLPRTLVYMHESQLTYPLPKGGTIDVDLVIQEVTTALAADRVVFNSCHHRDLFLRNLAPFFSRFPDHRPEGIEAAIREKARVLYPGVTLPSTPVPFASKPMEPPLVIWNHRWSYDKNFPATLHALRTLKERGVAFNLALLGESAGGQAEAPFHEACKVLGERVVHFGYCPNGDAYRQWLSRGAIVVSSAIQENFGISMVEAMAHGCLPLLPNRLAYPEILPEAFHGDHLYTSRHDFIAKLEALLTTPDPASAADLAQQMRIYDWKQCIALYDETLASV